MVDSGKESEAVATVILENGSGPPEDTGRTVVEKSEDDDNGIREIKGDVKEKDKQVVAKVEKDDLQDGDKSNGDEKNKEQLVDIGEENSREEVKDSKEEEKEAGSKGGVIGEEGDTTLHDKDGKIGEDESVKEEAKGQVMEQGIDKDKDECRKMEVEESEKEEAKVEKIEETENGKEEGKGEKMEGECGHRMEEEGNQKGKEEDKKLGEEEEIVNEEDRSDKMEEEYGLNKVGEDVVKDNCLKEDGERVQAEEKGRGGKDGEGSKKRQRGQKASEEMQTMIREVTEDKKEDMKKTEEDKEKKRKSKKNETVNESKAKELSAPIASFANRPVRERKLVERLVASIEKESVKEFLIEKGRGTPLKDIPNVVYKLSKRKVDDILKMLHVVLYGRRGKAFHIKNNISQFSGFVWRNNEEKQRAKVKEKLDKCVKDKLLEFCDVLDIPVAKTAVKKEDLVVKLLDFLVEPHATTDVILAGKDKSSKAKRRRRIGSGSGSRRSRDTPAKKLAKKRKKVEDHSKVKGAPETEDEEEDEDEDEGNDVSIADDVDRTPEHSGNEEREYESEEEEHNHSIDSKKESKKRLKRGSTVKFEEGSESEEDNDDSGKRKSVRSKRGSACKVKGGRMSEEDGEEAGKGKQSSQTQERKGSVARVQGSESEEDAAEESGKGIWRSKRSKRGSSAKVKKVSESDRAVEDRGKGKRGLVTSGKRGSSWNIDSKEKASKQAPPTTPPATSKKNVRAFDASNSSPVVSLQKSGNRAPKKSSIMPKSPSRASKAKIDKDVSKGKDRPKKKEAGPSDEELRDAICEILKEVDFNTATFTDILKQLAHQFSTELTLRKASIKLMIQEELTKLADEAAEDDDGDAEKEENTESAVKEVKA